MITLLLEIRLSVCIRYIRHSNVCLKVRWLNMKEPLLNERSVYEISAKSCQIMKLIASLQVICSYTDFYKHHRSVSAISRIIECKFIIKIHYVTLSYDLLLKVMNLSTSLNQRMTSRS